MIKNKRDLALALNNKGKVDVAMISKKLNSVITLWESRSEVIIDNNTIIGNF